MANAAAGPSDDLRFIWLVRMSQTESATASPVARRLKYPTRSSEPSDAPSSRRPVPATSAWASRGSASFSSRQANAKIESAASIGRPKVKRQGAS